MCWCHIKGPRKRGSARDVSLGRPELTRLCGLGLLEDETELKRTPQKVVQDAACKHPCAGLQHRSHG